MSTGANLDLTADGGAARAVSTPCLTVVIPCFNEQDTVAEAVQRVLAKDSVAEVIIVDDASTDGSWSVISRLNDPRIRLARHGFNLGKGAAIALGISMASSPFTVIQDADLEYNPDEFDMLLEPLLSGRADVVYGSRFHTDRPHRVLYYWHSVGNKLLTIASNMASNVNLTDMETCYKMGRTDLMQSLDLREDRFGVEPEMTLKLARRGARIYEVGISYDGRTYDEGKKIGWRDGVRALYCILKYRLVRVGPPGVSGGGTAEARASGSGLSPDGLSDEYLSGLLIDLRDSDVHGDRLDALRSDAESPAFAIDLSGSRDHQRMVLAGVSASLEPGERLVLIVPTRPSLGGRSSSAGWGSAERHSVSSLRRMVAGSGLVVEQVSFGNPLDAVRNRLVDASTVPFRQGLLWLCSDPWLRELAERLGRRFELTSATSLVCVTRPSGLPEDTPPLRAT